VVRTRRERPLHESLELLVALSERCLYAVWPDIVRTVHRFKESGLIFTQVLCSWDSVWMRENLELLVTKHCLTWYLVRSSDHRVRSQ